MTGLLRRFRDYADFGLRFFVLRREGPFVLGLVTNDSCNLHCIDCRVADIHGTSMPFERIRLEIEDGVALADDTTAACRFSRWAAARVNWRPWK